jgi:hypothetical protein
MADLSDGFSQRSHLDQYPAVVGSDQSSVFLWR